MKVVVVGAEAHVPMDDLAMFGFLAKQTNRTQEVTERMYQNTADHRNV